MKLGKFSIGVGDRFSHQGKAQLRAIMRANETGLEINPVWNKSNREHTYVHSEPIDTRREADEAERVDHRRLQPDRPAVQRRRPVEHFDRRRHRHDHRQEREHQSGIYRLSANEHVVAPNQESKYRNSDR